MRSLRASFFLFQAFFCNFYNALLILKKYRENMVLFFKRAKKSVLRRHLPTSYNDIAQGGKRSRAARIPYCAGYIMRAANGKVFIKNHKNDTGHLK